MKLRLLLFLLPLVLWLCPAHGQLITATVSFTNSAGTTNGQTITLNGSVRTWTNSVYSSTTQILTNSSAAGSATNLYNHLGLSPLAGTAVSYGSSTSVVVRGFPNLALTVTLSAGYGEVSYTTNSLTSGTIVRVPNTLEADAVRTNVATELVNWLNQTAATNQLAQSAPAMSQLLGTTNTQTIAGNKAWQGTNTFHHAYSTNLQVTGSATINAPTTTNLVNYGNAIRSPGSGADSEQFGSGANAAGSFSIALGYDAGANENAAALGNAASAEGQASSAVGNEATATGAGSTAIGNQAVANADYGTAIGATATVDSTHTNSVALGYAALTTKRNQIVLGSANHVVTVAGSYEHVYATGTNSFSDLAWRRYAITSLANGNNAGIVIGTNTFVEVSGPSGAFTINGMTGSPSRDGHFVIVLNQTGQDMTVAHQSGTDPTAANRIITMTGADRATTGNGAATFIYSAAASRWILIALDP